MSQLKREPFRRYMKQEDARDILKNGSLTLRTSDRWTDKNDQEILRCHKEVNRVPELLVACFTKRVERNHQWLAYGYKNHCVQVNFYKERLIESLEKYKLKSNQKVLYGPIQYRNIYDLRRSENIPQSKIAFIKRKAYIDEKEFRVIAYAKEGVTEIKIPIDLKCINYIRLDPRSSQLKVDEIENELKDLANSLKIPVRPSRMNHNPKWTDEFRRSIGYPY